MYKVGTTLAKKLYKYTWPFVLHSSTPSLVSTSVDWSRSDRLLAIEGQKYGGMHYDLIIYDELEKETTHKT